jgi:hypothetical protein
LNAAEVDHLVVAAASLGQGDAWCEALFGARPVAGGRHTGMGTHNRLLAIGSAAFPRAYLEIIAVDPDATPPPRPRWFGLDSPDLQQRLRQRPRLVHVVARCRELDAALGALCAIGLDPGPAVAAERAGAHGVLRWRIAGRADGALLCGGALPTLIEWGELHPADQLPPSPVRLEALTLGGVPAAAAQRLGLPGVAWRDGPPALQAEFESPRGRVPLSSAD